MSLAICSLASGSSGNCYLVKSNTAAILVDAGISAKQIGLRLEAIGLSIDDLDGLLITHEHSDHTKGVKPILKHEGIRLYVNSKTLEGLGDDIDSDRVVFFNTGDTFEIGDLTISSFPLSHDAADPTGFSFLSCGRKISIVTDTGIVTPLIYDCIKHSDILVLESNHDEAMLRIGSYPWFLKQRILGEKGHLSNDAAAKILAELILSDGKDQKKQVLLAHLSKENNFPQMAMQTAINALEQAGISPGKEVEISTLSRDIASPVYIVE